MVDESGFAHVTSKFGEHNFQNQFRNPIERQTLFQSQVRRLKWQQKQELNSKEQAKIDGSGAPMLEPLYS